MSATAGPAMKGSWSHGRADAGPTAHGRIFTPRLGENREHLPPVSSREGTDLTSMGKCEQWWNWGEEKALSGSNVVVDCLRQPYSPRVTLFCQVLSIVPPLLAHTTLVLSPLYLPPCSLLVAARWGGIRHQRVPGVNSGPDTLVHSKRRTPIWKIGSEGGGDLIRRVE